jgi:hypothetical protein
MRKVPPPPGLGRGAGPGAVGAMALVGLEHPADAVAVGEVAEHAEELVDKEVGDGAADGHLVEGAPSLPREPPCWCWIVRR